jgi:GT2 family glycosyltransferase
MYWAREVIGIVVLNWNGWRDTVELLRSLIKIVCNNLLCDIVLIDNGSNDSSVPKLIEWFRKNSVNVLVITEEEAKSCSNTNLNLYNIIFILNQRNYGYAGGMNKGIIFVKNCLKADYVVLLNNDTIVDKNFVAEMYKVFKYPKIGQKIAVVGPKVLNYYTNTAVPIEQYILPLPLASILIKFFDNIAVTEKHLSKEQSLIVNRLDGSCYMVKTKVFDEIGLLNEDFFTYWEDTDFFVRIKKHGYFIVLVPKSVIKHKIGAANMILKRVSARASYYFGRNAIHFINLHYEGINNMLALFTFILISAYIFSSYLFYYRNLKAAKLFLLGIVKGLLKERSRSTLLNLLLKQR